MVQTKELKQMISDSGLKKKHIADALGLSRQGFMNKVEGKRKFTMREVTEFCKVLHIDDLNQVRHIFFA